MSEERLCPICGNVLIQRPNEANFKFKHRKYCSVDCVIKHSAAQRRERFKLPDRSCSVCGEMLVKRDGEDAGNWKRRKTCGRRECISGLQQQIKIEGRQELPDRYCVGCGLLLSRRPNEDFPNWAKRKSCGLGCRAAAVSAASQHRLYQRTCQNCGAQFSPRPDEPIGKFNMRKACSDKCRRALTAAQLFQDYGTKECEGCGKTFHRRLKKESRVQWESRKYCSHRCFKEHRPVPRLELAPKYCKSCGQLIIRRDDEKIGNFRHRQTCGDPDCAKAAVRRSLALSIRPTKFYPIEFKAMRERVLKRDNYRCRLCDNPGGLAKGSRNGGLHIHHINYFKEDIRIDNLVSLCRSCHMKTNYRRSEWEAFFTAITSTDNPEG